MPDPILNYTTSLLAFSPRVLVKIYMLYGNVWIFISIIKKSQRKRREKVVEKNGTKPQIPQPAFRLKNAFKVDFLKRPPENKKPYASIYCLAQIKYHIPRKVSSLIFILPWLLWNKFNIQHTKGRKNKLQYLCLKIAPNCAIRLLPRDLPFPRGLLFKQKPAARYCGRSRLLPPD